MRFGFGKAAGPNAPAASQAKAPTQELMLLIDNELKRRYGVSATELIRHVPTYPTPVAVVWRSWPASLRERISLKSLRGLLRRQLLHFHYDWRNISVQLHLSESDGFGAADSHFLSGALRHAEKISEITSCLSRRYIPTPLAETLCHVRLKEYTDVVEFNDDRSMVRLRFEFACLQCSPGSPEGESLNHLIAEVVRRVPTEFVHYSGVGVPVKTLAHNGMAHVLQWKFPLVRLEPTFQHPLKGCCDEMAANASPQHDPALFSHSSPFAYKGCAWRQEVFERLFTPAEWAAHKDQHGPWVAVTTFRSQRASLPAVVALGLHRQVFVVKWEQLLGDALLCSLLSSHDVLKLWVKAETTAAAFSARGVPIRGSLDVRAALLFLGAPYRGRISKAFSWRGLASWTQYAVNWHPSSQLEASAWDAVALMREQLEYASGKASVVACIGDALYRACGQSSLPLAAVAQQCGSLTLRALVRVSNAVRSRSPLSPLLLLDQRKSDEDQKISQLDVAADLGVPATVAPLEQQGGSERQVQDATLPQADINDAQAQFDLFEPVVGERPIATVADSQPIVSVDTDVAERYRELQQLLHTAQSNPVSSTALAGDAQAEFDVFAVGEPCPGAGLSLAAPAAASKPAPEKQLTLGFVQPLVPVVPAPPLSAKGRLPPSTLGVWTKAKQTKIGQTPKAPPTAAPLVKTVSVDDLSDDMRQKIAEEWLQRQLQSQISKF